MFVIETSFFNLDQIYNSAQTPRWIKLKDLHYIIPHKDKALKIQQQNDRYDLNKCRLIMNCSEEDFYNIWFEYFDLRTDYFEQNMKVRKLGGKFKRIANRGGGIHILNQDIFEAYILGKLIIHVGYSEADTIINHIAKVCGIEHNQSMREAGRITWYEWPTPEMILENFNKLDNMGKVNNWLKKLCEAMVNDGLDITENLINSSGNELLKLLVLHDVSNFPLNGIENTLIKNFGENPEEFADWYLDDIENKGLVYMYIVHHIISKTKEAISKWD